MSYIEWVSRNGRGRLRLYCDQAVHRFDKLSGSLDGRFDNVMVVHRDDQLGIRRIIVAEQGIIWEDEQHVYIRPIGRKVSSTEPYSVRYTPIHRRRTQQREVIIQNE